MKIEQNEVYVPVGSCVCVNITYPTWIILLMQVWNAGFVQWSREPHTDSFRSIKINK